MENLLLRDTKVRTFTEKRTSENPSTNLETRHARTQPLYKLHPTKAASRFHINRNRRIAKKIYEKNSHYLMPSLSLKNNEDDYMTYAGNVNRVWEKFKLNFFTEYQFKCLIFIVRLMSESQSDI